MTNMAAGMVALSRCALALSELVSSGDPATMAAALEGVIISVADFVKADPVGAEEFLRSAAAGVAKKAAEKIAGR